MIVDLDLHAIVPVPYIVCTLLCLEVTDTNIVIKHLIDKVTTTSTMFSKGYFVQNKGILPDFRSTTVICMRERDNAPSTVY
jgi:hypothetical protein